MNNYENFGEIVSSFGKAKEELKLLKDVTDNYAKTIKEVLHENEENTYSHGGYIVKLSERVSENFNELKLLNVAKNEWEKHHPNEPAPFIKTKEYVDMTVLESVIYNGEFDAGVLNDCKETKVTEVLTVKKEKKEKK